jgi:predicted DNA-binding transcriptional regulator AlpA
MFSRYRRSPAISSEDQKMKKKFYDAADLIAMNLFGSKMTLWREIKAGRFPPGRMTSRNSRKWTDQEIDDYVAGCPVERETDAGPESRDGEPEETASATADQSNSRDAERPSRDSASQPGRAA